MRRLGVAAAAATMIMLAAVDASAATYRGYISVGRGPAHVGSQGNAWTAVFRERVEGRVGYRVCLRHLDAPRVRRCARRRTGPAGRSRVFFALFVNDVGGTGRWRAIWRTGGRRVATWRFTVRPEFEG